MALRELEKIVANVIVLAGADVTLEVTSDELLTLLRDPSLQVQTQQLPGQPTQQLQILSLREQVQIVIADGRLIFEDKSADIPPRGRLPEIAHGFTALAAKKGLSKFLGYGFNFHIAFDAPGDSAAASLLLDRFVRTDRITERASIKPVGAGLRLYFDMAGASPAICRLRIEPRQDKRDTPRFFGEINYHYDLPEGVLPDPDLLKSDFHGKWQFFADLVERLVIS